MKLIYRKKYMDELLSLRSVPDIKIITGIRRSGKSKLLECLRDYLINDEDVNVIYINYGKEVFDDIKEYHKLNEYVSKRYISGKENFLLIDEVQLCDNFEKAIISFHTEEKYNIYITGSNAFLLSSDLATLFVGRYYPIDVYPFSLNEYIEYMQIEDKNIAFDNYVKDGGMAGSYLYSDEHAKYKYLNDIIDVSIIRDIEKKYKIKNTKILNDLNIYLTDNISNLSNVNNIVNEFVKNKSNITNKTLANYITYLCRAFLFYEVKRYDIRGKKLFSSSNKYYLSDHSFRFALLGTTRMDYGRIYENIVAIELLRRGYEIYIGNLYEKEIDFVAKKRDEIIYIQVSDDISNKETYEREISSLLKIKNSYPKIIIARTKHEMTIDEGIKIYDIAEWLTKNEK